MSDEIEDQKRVEFYSAGLAAWYATRLEHDKSLLTLSAGGIGLLMTLMTTVGVSSAESLVLYVCALVQNNRGQTPVSRFRGCCNSNPIPSQAGWGFSVDGAVPPAPTFLTQCRARSFFGHEIGVNKTELPRHPGDQTIHRADLC